MAQHGGKRPGSGRKKGTPNKITADVKGMVLEALNRKGGAAYLERQADENPNAFMSLVGKVLPMQVTGPPDADGNPTALTVKFIKPDDGN